VSRCVGPAGRPFQDGSAGTPRPTSRNLAPRVGTSACRGTSALTPMIRSVYSRAMKHLLLSCLLTAMSLSHAEEDLYSEVYSIPGFFWEQLARLDRSSAILEESAYQGAFERAGVAFPEGAAVKFDQKTSQLTVRAERAQQSKILEILNRLKPYREPLLSIQIEEAIFSEEMLPAAKFGSLDVNPVVQSTAPGIRQLESREALIEELRHPPVASAPNDSLLSSGISGVFTEPQYQKVRDDLVKRGITFHQAPLAKVTSGKPVLVQEGGKRWGVVQSFGEYSVDLELYFPAQGEKLFQAGDSPEPSARLTVWDGQTVSWAEKMKNGELRVVFTTLRIVDASGNPAN